MIYEKAGNKGRYDLSNLKASNLKASVETRLAASAACCIGAAYGDGASPVSTLIQQVFLAELDKILQALLPCIGNPPRVLPGFQRIKCCRIHQ